jgi:hypothetical protein
LNQSVSKRSGMILRWKGWPLDYCVLGVKQFLSL